MDELGFVIYCQSREYRAGGGDDWDSLLGLVVGCDGLAAGSAAHSVRQAGRGYASLFMSPVQRAGADPAPDSTLGAIRRNGFGKGNSVFAPPSGNETWRERVTRMVADGMFDGEPPTFDWMIARLDKLTKEINAH